MTCRISKPHCCTRKIPVRDHLCQLWDTQSFRAGDVEDLEPKGQSNSLLGNLEGDSIALPGCLAVEPGKKVAGKSFKTPGTTGFFKLISDLMEKSATIDGARQGDGIDFRESIGSSPTCVGVRFFSARDSRNRVENFASCQ
jgi:hypothetical protein